MRRLKYFLLILAPLVLIGCTKNPVTGKKELTLVSESQEVALGKQNFSYLSQASGGEYTAYPELTRYVSDVGMRLAKVSDRPNLPFEFVIINQSVPNAWALPGGKIAINRGLLVELETEAELAAVLAHEIVHAAARHGAKNVERGVLFQTGTSALSQAAGGKYSDVITSSSKLAGGVVMMSYSREAEREADFYGIEYMARAGYDVKAAVSLQEKFVRLSKQNRKDWTGGLFASHPPSQERVENNQQTIQQYPPGGRVGREEYQRMIAPLKRQRAAYEMFDKAQRLLEQGTMQAAVSLATSAANRVPTEARFNGLIGQAAALRGDWAGALQYQDQAIALDGNYFEHRLDRAMTHLNLGNTKLAKEDLLASLEMLPTAAAHAELGKIAYRQGDSGSALFHLGAAVEKDPMGRSEEELLLHRLKLDTAPEELVSVEPAVDSQGYLLLNVENSSRVDVDEVILQLIVGDGVGGVRNRREVPLYRRVPSGHRIQIQTDIHAEGEGMWSLDDKVKTRLLQLRQAS